MDRNLYCNKCKSIQPFTISHSGKKRSCQSCGTSGSIDDLMTICPKCEGNTEEYYCDLCKNVGEITIKQSRDWCMAMDSEHWCHDWSMRQVKESRGE